MGLTRSSMARAIARAPLGHLLSVRDAVDPATPEADWFVDSAVSASGDGTSYATAFKTVQEAHDAASAGEIIEIAGGAYREMVTLAASGSSGNRIVTRAREVMGTPDVVRILGSELFTDVDDCTDAADALGSADWANCKKAFVPSGVTISGIGLGLRQGDTSDAAGPSPMYMASMGGSGSFDALADHFFAQDSSRFASLAVGQSGSLATTSSGSNATHLDGTTPWAAIRFQPATSHRVCGAKFLITAVNTAGDLKAHIYEVGNATPVATMASAVTVSSVYAGGWDKPFDFDDTVVLDSGTEYVLALERVSGDFTLGKVASPGTTISYSAVQAGNPYNLSADSGMDASSDLRAGPTQMTDTAICDDDGPLSTLTADTDLDDAYCSVYYSPGNGTLWRKVAAFDHTQNRMQFDDVSYFDGSGGETTLSGAYSLFNVGPAISMAGQYAFKYDLEGDGTRKVVWWPLEADDTNVSYCARSHTLDPNDNDYHTFQNIIFEDHGSTINVASGTLFGGFGDYLRLEDCKVGYGSDWGNPGIGGGLIALTYDTVPNDRFLGFQSIRTDVYHSYKQHGVSVLSANCDWIDGSISRVAGSGLRPHVSDHFFLSRTRIEDIDGTHSNGASTYQGADWPVFHGIDIDVQTASRFTMQTTSNILVLCPVIRGSRAIDNNGTAAGPDGTDSVNAVINATVVPEAGQTITTATSAIDNTGTPGTSHVINALAHGDCSFAGGGTVGTGNVEGTYSNSIQTVIGSTQSDTADHFVANQNALRSGAAWLAAALTDYANDDFTPVAKGPLDGTGANVSALVSRWKTEFAGREFVDRLDTDFAGNAVDWDSDVFVGAVKPAANTKDLDQTVSIDDITDAELDTEQVISVTIDTDCYFWIDLPTGADSHRMYQSDGTTALDQPSTGPVLAGPGQVYKITATSSASYETTTSVSGTIGNTAFSFDITTLAEPAEIELVEWTLPNNKFYVSGGIPGASDINAGTFAWRGGVKNADSASYRQLIFAHSNGSIDIYLSAGTALVVRLKNTAGTLIAARTSTQTFSEADGIFTLMVSWDASAGTFSAYKDSTPLTMSSSGPSAGSGPVDWTTANLLVGYGGSGANTNFFGGYYGCALLETTAADLSNAAVRANYNAANIATTAAAAFWHAGPGDAAAWNTPSWGLTKAGSDVVDYP